jgi:hypothetical protein
VEDNISLLRLKLAKIASQELVQQACPFCFTLPAAGRGDYALSA